jgi:DNA topoisomerase-2
MFGHYTLKGRTLVVDELPVDGTNCIAFSKYEKVIIPGLKESGIISDVEVENPDENHCRYVFKLTKDMSHDDILKKFRLSSKLTNTCFYLLDEHGVVKRFKTPEEILDYWLNIRMQFMEKRKSEIMEKLRKEMVFLNPKLRFVEAVVNGDIKIMKTKRQDVINQMVRLDITRDADLQQKFLSIPLISCTKEKIEELQNQLETLRNKMIEVGQTTVQVMYLRDLENIN